MMNDDLCPITGRPPYEGLSQDAWAKRYIAVFAPLIESHLMDANRAAASMWENCRFDEPELVARENALAIQRQIDESNDHKDPLKGRPCRTGG